MLYLYILQHTTLHSKCSYHIYVCIRIDWFDITNVKAQTIRDSVNEQILTDIISFFASHSNGTSTIHVYIYMAIHSIHTYTMYL